MSISNGTCYFAPGEQSTDNIIPCGNAGNGVYACCQETDYCLEYGACYNYTCKCPLSTLGLKSQGQPHLGHFLQNDVCGEQASHNRRLTLRTDRTTYVSGCTDPDFTDPSCPPKDTSPQQLLAWYNAQIRKYPVARLSGADALVRRRRRRLVCQGNVPVAGRRADSSPGRRVWRG